MSFSATVCYCKITWSHIRPCSPVQGYFLNHVSFWHFRSLEIDLLENSLHGEYIQQLLCWCLNLDANMNSDYVLCKIISDCLCVFWIPLQDTLFQNGSLFLRLCALLVLLLSYCRNCTAVCHLFLIMSCFYVFLVFKHSFVAKLFLNCIN